MKLMNTSLVIRKSQFIIVIILLMPAMFTVQAQGRYEAVLRQIEANNTTLAALRRQIEAQKLGNRTGLAPANPEVEFNYLWGNPSLIGNRTDIKVTQTFDFPTAYTYRGKIANLQNRNAELSYKAERINLLLSAKQTCIELAYYDALAREYAVRLQNAERIAAGSKVELEKGETNILEYNKTQLNLSAVQTEAARIEAERVVLLAELKRLNGGEEIENYSGDKDDALDSQSVIAASTLPLNFEEWYAAAEAKSPVLQYVSAQIEIERRQIKLNRALGLPRFSAGYMSEKVAGEHFQGITVGVSIPLWENRNRVKQAKVQALAAEEMLNDSKIQFYNRLQALYRKAATLRQNTLELRRSLAENNNEPLLKKALDAGEISLLSYLLEAEYYYDTMNKMLEAERDYELAEAELWAVEM